MSDPFRAVKLQQISTELRDGTHGTHQRVSVGIPFLSAKNIGKNGQINWSQEDDRISSREFELIHSNFSLNPGDLLLTIVGSLGRVAVYRGERVTFQRSVAYIRPNPALASSDFLHHAFRHPSFQSQLISRSNATAQAGLYLGELAKTEILLFSLAEQEKIAQILDTLDTQIKKTEALIAKLEKIKEGLLHDLLTRGIDQNGQLRPTPEQAPELYKESALGLIPKEWAIRSIADAGVKLIDGDRGTNYPSEQDFSTGSGHCVFLSARNVTRSGFRFNACQFISKDKDRILGTGKLIRDDVVVTTRGTVGNFAHYSRDIAFEHIRINSGMLILRITESNLLSEFLYLSLKEHLFDRENSRKGSGSAQPQLPARDFQSFSLVIPSQSEQGKIIELSSIENQTIEAEIREYQTLLSLKSALMDDLLTGQVRVTPLLKDEV